MRSTSPKPSVVTKTVRSPLRSNRALVATVVPILTASTAPGGSDSPFFKPRRRRMPSTAASLYCSALSVSSLWVTSEPSDFRATTSEKVPPRSIQHCQPACRLSWSLIPSSLYVNDHDFRAAQTYQYRRDTVEE